MYYISNVWQILHWGGKQARGLGVSAVLGTELAEASMQRLSGRVVRQKLPPRKGPLGKRTFSPVRVF